jgi:hypothetical protein
VELPKAGEECQVAGAEWRKAGEELRKAGEELRKADAEWLAAYNASHSVVCKEPECPWNGKTIFA